MTKSDQKMVGVMVFSGIGVLLLVGVIFGSCDISRAGAQVPQVDDLTREERRLALVLARVSYNEAADSAADLELITQVVFSARVSAGDRVQWLRGHSPCVSGRLTQDQAYRRPGNCRWSRNLMPDGRRPRGWSRELHGRWLWIRDRWLAHLARAVGLVRVDETPTFCAETPTTWDGRRYGRERIEARGWRVLECRERSENFALRRARVRGGA